MQTRQLNLRNHANHCKNDAVLYRKLLLSTKNTVTGDSLINSSAFLYKWLSLQHPLTRTCCCGMESRKHCHLCVTFTYQQVPRHWKPNVNTLRFISFVLSTTVEPSAIMIWFGLSKPSRKKKNLLVHLEIHTKPLHLVFIPLHSAKRHFLKISALQAKRRHFSSSVWL